MHENATKMRRQHDMIYKDNARYRTLIHQQHVTCYSIKYFYDIPIITRGITINMLFQFYFITTI